jgi:hypothetical protein
MHQQRVQFQFAFLDVLHGTIGALEPDVFVARIDVIVPTMRPGESLVTMGTFERFQTAVTVDVMLQIRLVFTGFATNRAELADSFVVRPFVPQKIALEGEFLRTLGAFINLSIVVESEVAMQCCLTSKAFAAKLTHAVLVEPPSAVEAHVIFEFVKRDHFTADGATLWRFFLDGGRCWTIGWRCTCQVVFDDLLAQQALLTKLLGLAQLVATSWANLGVRPHQLLHGQTGERQKPRQPTGILV